MLMIDVSQSSFFGTQNEFKNHIIAEISGILAFSAITNNDKVGVIFFSSEVEKFIPPKKGKTHILRIISDIYDFHPKKSETNIAEALKYLNNVVKKKCIAFLISDFLISDSTTHSAKDFKNSINIVGKKHDLIGLHIYDEREANLPNAGLIKVMDAETKKEFWIDTSKKSLRDKYAKDFKENLRNVKDLFGKSGSQLESLKTEDSYVVALMNMFKKRELKR
ncbi:MAG: VWA domain-containing protein [Chitinophagales bacterium]|nr:VWA domain-containing protein [Chitinophagales bacterium]